MQSTVLGRWGLFKELVFDVFREFGVSYRTCRNPPCSIAQGFCSKSADFGPSEMLPKSPQINSRKVRNAFARMYSTFWGSLGLVTELAKIRHVQNHARPGFLFKIGRFRSNWKFPPKSSQINLYQVRNPFARMSSTFLGSLGLVTELAEIRHVQNHGPRVFAQKRLISAQWKIIPNRLK